jgi:hypothetical protein
MIADRIDSAPATTGIELIQGQIPQQLVDAGARFCLLQGKEPVRGSSWKAGYSHNDPALVEHIARGGNYGVVLTGDLVVVDTDHMIAEDIAIERLPPTYTVRTSKGHHRYYLCHGYDQVGHITREGVQLADILVAGKSYAVGPGSTHATGIRYEVDADIPIATIPTATLREYTTIITQTQAHTQAHSDIAAHKDDYKRTLGNSPPLSVPVTHRDIDAYKEAHKRASGEDDEDLGEVNLWKDDEFLPTHHSLRAGIAILNFHDLNTVRKKNVIIRGKREPVYETRGDVLRSPTGFVGFSIYLRLTLGGCRSLRTLPEFSSGYVVCFRSSEKTWTWQRISKEEYEEYIHWSDQKIIDQFPEFIRANNSKLANWRKNNSYVLIFGELLNGYYTSSITDSDMVQLCYVAVERAYSDEDIHKMHKTYYKERYDKTETDAQIAHSRQKVAKKIKEMR